MGDENLCTGGWILCAGGKNLWTGGENSCMRGRPGAQEERIHVFEGHSWESQQEVLNDTAMVSACFGLGVPEL